MRARRVVLVALIGMCLIRYSLKSQVLVRKIVRRCNKKYTPLDTPLHSQRGYDGLRNIPPSTHNAVTTA